MQPYCHSLVCTLRLCQFFFHSLFSALSTHCLTSMHWHRPHSHLLQYKRVLNRYHCTLAQAVVFNSQVESFSLLLSSRTLCQTSSRLISLNKFSTTIMSKRMKSSSGPFPPLKRFHSEETIFWSRTAENNYLLVDEEKITGPQGLWICCSWGCLTSS